MISQSETVDAAGDVGPEAKGAVESIPSDGLIILPVREMVLLPGTVMPIAISRERSIAAAQQAVREERQIGVLMQRDAGTDEPVAPGSLRPAPACR